MSVFCRHNRFLADCKICSKGTALDSERPARRKAAGATRPRPGTSERGGAPSFSGPYVAGPARHDADGALCVVRLERVPGGVRLGEWFGASLRPSAPVLPADELADLMARAGEALQARDAARLTAALAVSLDPEAGGDAGISRGRSGDFKEELRIEALEDGRLRVARWVLRPVSGWELQDAPPMLPAARYAEALTDAVRRGLVAPAAASESPASA